jgi:NAD(P)-dependent dehydrogenase (short-subunit alcohol dehydrogenase family)
MGKLDGKVALITGGNSGIGLATAKQFVDEGAYVFITGRREAELSGAVKDIGKNVTAVQGDVSNLGDLERLFAQIKRDKGKLDIIFANAGVARYAPLGSITEEFYDSIFNINVKGVLFTVQKALPLLPDGASIILSASIVGSKGLAANSVYSATKAAVRSFARTWTTDLKDRHIRVNAVSPGSTDTPGLSDLLASSEIGEQRRKMISSTVPLGRFGTADEIAKAVVFLASDDASYITGTELSMAASHRCSEPIADRTMTRSSEMRRAIPSSSSHRPSTSFRLAKTKSTNAVTLGDRSECAGITRLIGVGTVPQPGKTGASDPLVTKSSPI